MSERRRDESSSSSSASSDSGHRIQRRRRTFGWSCLKNTVLIGRTSRSRRSSTLPTPEQSRESRRGDQSGNGIGSASHPDEGRSTPGILQHSAAAQASGAQVSGNNLLEDGLASGGSRSAQEQSESSTARSLSQTNSLPERATSQTAGAVSSSNTSTRPPFDVKVDDLKNILDFIEKAAKIAEENGTPSKFGVPDIIKENLEGAANIIQNIGTVCKDLVDPKGLGKDMAAESTKVLRKVLRGAGNLHWAGAGLLILASVLDRIDQTSKNKEGCIKVLKRLVDLGGQLVRLYQLFQEKDKIVQAAAVVAEGAVLCDEYLSYGHIKRFGLAQMHKSKFEALEDCIRHLYSDLQLSAITEDLSVNTDIRNRTPMPLDPSYRPDYPTLAVGIKEKHSEALERLGVLGGIEIAAGDQALLIHGMGGIGKTTLATAVCGGPPFLEHSFAEVKFDEIVTERDICRCQSIIYERLSGIPRKIESCNEGRKAVAECFKSSRSPILLLVDNIFNATNLKDIFSYPLELPDRSGIVVTSRNSGVIADAYCIGDVRSTEYSVSGLNLSQARNLLEHHLGERPRQKESEIDLVLEWCDGLPLALEMMGAYLRVEKDEGWKETVRCLRRHKKDGENVTDLMVDRRLDEIFNLSYNALGNNVKKAFLDVTCLLRQEDLEWVEKSKFKAMKKVSLVKKRIERSRRVTFTEAWTKWGLAGASRMSSAHIHFHCVSFAKHLAGKTRLVSIDDQLLPDLLQENVEIGCEKVEGLVVKFSGQPLPSRKLDKMSRLRILILEEAELLGDCQRAASELEIYSVRRGVLPFYNAFQLLQNLRVLDFHCIDGRCLESAKLPVTLETLTLIDVESLVSFHGDAFQNCSSLHTVQIENCWSLRELPESFSELRSLSVLVLSENPDLKSLPSGFHRLKNLQSIFMRGLSAMSLPSKFSELPSLQELFLGGVSTPRDSFSKLHCLECLFLRAVDLHDSLLDTKSLSSLQVLDMDIRGFQNFKAVDCSQLRSLSTLRLTIPADMREIHSVLRGSLFVQELVLLNCGSLKQLPEKVVEFKSLQVLRLGGCISLKKLPGRVGKLHALRELRLEGCCKLQRLPKGFTQLKSLESLVLWDCEALAELPRGFWNLLALKTLELRCCKSLVYLPNDLPQLNALETISLTCCQSLETLPEGFSNLPQLHSLELEGCEKMQALPGDIFRLKKLRKLSLTGFKSLKELPLIRENGMLLEQLVLSKCESLIRLPEDISKLNSLNQLWLSGCRSLEELPEGFENLPQLYWLDLSWCDKFWHLPNDFFNLKRLRYVNLQGCESLQLVPPIHNHAVALQSLNVSGCLSLALLPKDLGKIESLEELRLSRCRLLEEIPEGLGNLPHFICSEPIECETLQALPDDIFGWIKELRFLNLSGCKSLLELPAFRRNQWEEINLSGCENLIRLPNNLPGLNSLVRLKLYGCRSLEELPGGFGNLPQLLLLDLTGCRGLRRLPDDFFSLKSLRDLSLNGCKSLRELPPVPETGLSLIKLDLLGSGCNGIIQWLEVFSKLGNIEKVNLEEWLSLCQLSLVHWNGFALTELNMSGCKSIAHLPSDFGKLKTLKELKLQGCTLLENLPEGFGNLSALESLGLNGCERIKDLSQDFGKLKCLKKLRLQGCTSLEKLPEGFGNLSALESLGLSGCERIRDLSQDFGKLKSLKVLLLQGCSSLEKLPEGFVNLSVLESLYLTRCKRIRDLSHDFFQLKKLRYLLLEECNALQALPPVRNYGSNVQHVAVSGCKGLVYLPTDVPRVHALEMLRLPEGFADLCLETFV